MLSVAAATERRGQQQQRSVQVRPAQGVNELAFDTSVVLKEQVQQIASFTNRAVHSLLLHILLEVLVWATLGGQLTDVCFLSGFGSYHCCLAICSDTSCRSCCPGCSGSVPTCRGEHVTSNLAL